ncbi:hypothetical protein [Draconibacterium sediminis]|uniref:Glycoside hydrolase family 5 domain-containing protein n=1 Tax=Draconibacterium sediminis TaxID=1544798 RepID=A0A0D8JEI9_9BACT|nr:hypothetical protein [Draconibacterium sediminis]KJF45315.1 hypothetical protein LH29_08025 [Draconibacterium sediminis]
MKSVTLFIILVVIYFSSNSCKINKNNPKELESGKNTKVEIQGEKFLINGKPTFEGRIWNGVSVEGLLPNSRMVQGIFDDLNPETVTRWNYPDGKWSAKRNNDEFVAAMSDWHNYGLLAFTINMQGGSPMGYGNKNWYNSAYYEDGKLRKDYMQRLDNILKKADQLGMVPILGLFYFGQDQNLKDEAAVIAATDNAIEWLSEKGYKNVIIEVGNESNNRAYDHSILKQDRIHELILRIKDKAPYLFVSTSFNGNTLPTEKVVEVADFILVHGNGIENSERITEMVKQIRAMDSYSPKPIVFNEDDHFDFEKDQNNYINATLNYASWGFFDYRMEGEDFDEGFQSIPVNWEISSDRKLAFFKKTRQIFIK